MKSCQDQRVIVPLPEIVNCRHVLGFDFDDTLVLKGQSPWVDPQFFEAIERYRREKGAVWGIATGRSLEHLVEGIESCQFPFLPDFVVGREREVYFSDAAGQWHPHEDWNLGCQRAHHLIFEQSDPVFRDVQTVIKRETKARWVSITGDEAGIVASSVAEMDWLQAYIETLPQPADLSFERNSIYLRFSHRDFHKGSSLLAAALRWGMTREGILAVGDNFNDLSMLEEEVSCTCGCPANAIPEVKEFVQKRDGTVATHSGSEGVVEILDHFFRNAD